MGPLEVVMALASSTIAADQIDPKEVSCRLRTLRRHVWFLRRTGITAQDIEREVRRILRASAQIQTNELFLDRRSCSRILTHWWHESRYLDTRGQPLALRFDGPAPTFRSLVGAAIPGTDAAQALRVLKRSGLVSRRGNGRIRLISGISLPLEGPRDVLSMTLEFLAAASDTGYMNLRAVEDERPRRLQRSVFTEHLDRRHLRAYEEFLDESAQAFLAMHHAWLKRHESRHAPRQTTRRGRVGIGLLRTA